MAHRTMGFGFGQPLTPVVKRLLIANAVVFFAMLVIDREFFYEWFAFHPDQVFARPWGALTYMFVHADFMHILVNMIALFFFGPPLESRWGGKEFFRFYLIAGVGGVAFGLVFAQGSAVVGASAAVFGVMLAFAMNWPESPIYVWGIFPVKAKWLVAFLFVMTLFSTFGEPGGPVAHFAHLGGLVTAFLYLKMGDRASYGLERLRQRTQRTSRKVRRLAIVPRDEEDEGAAPSEEPRWATDDERRLLDAVDRVLDKISEEGIGALTAEERRILDEAARRRRMN